MRLLTAATTGNGPTLRRIPHPTPDAEQFLTLYVWGTFNGAVVRIEVSPGSDAPWFDTGLEITEATAVNLEFRSRNIRGIVDGGSSPSINAELV
jgi:hypothetical protein